MNQSYSKYLTTKNKNTISQNVSQSNTTALWSPSSSVSYSPNAAIPYVPPIIISKTIQGTTGLIGPTGVLIGSILPSNDLSFNIGSATNRIHTLYADQIFVGPNTIHIGEAKISANEKKDKNDKTETTINFPLASTMGGVPIGSIIITAQVPTKNELPLFFLVETGETIIYEEPSGSQGTTFIGSTFMGSTFSNIGKGVISGNGYITTGESLEDINAGHMFVSTVDSPTDISQWADIGLIRGPVGPQGITGPTGAQGSTGSQGYTGPTGAQGSTGITGPQGYQGHTGITGSKGDKGDKGAQGEPGLLSGSQGYMGDTGAQGYTGSTGSQGYTGSTGAQGAQGYTGAPGYTGKFGSTESITNTITFNSGGMIQLGNSGGITGVGTIFVTNLTSENMNVTNLLNTPLKFEVLQYISSSANIVTGINGIICSNLLGYNVITTAQPNYFPANGAQGRIGAGKTGGIILQTNQITSGNINIRTGSTADGSESISWPFTKDVYYNSIIMSTVPGSTGIFYISPQENPNYSLTIGATGSVNVAGTLTCNRYNGPYYIRGTCPTPITTTLDLISSYPFDKLYQFYILNTTSSITITLPVPSSNYEGASCWFKRQIGSNSFVISCSTSIYPLSSITLTNLITVSFQCLLYCDGTYWNVLSMS
jgi:hypothetical protein